MAKVYFGQGISDIRGRMGGSVFSRNQFGAYVKGFAPPVQPNSTSQMNVRTNFTALSAAWSALTDLERGSWLSQTLKLTDSQGHVTVLRGYQLFLLINRNRFVAGEVATNLAPSSFDVPTVLTSLQLDFSEDDEPTTPTKKLLKISFAPAPFPDTAKLIVRASKKWAVSRNTFKGSERILGLINPTDASPVDLTSAWESKYGEMSIENDENKSKVGFAISVYNTVNGMMSVPYMGMCIYGQIATIL